MSRNAAPSTFLEACLAGRTSVDQIDDWVERWHKLGPRDRRTLAEYLGMSGDEYARWVERPASLDAILRARTGTGVASGVNSASGTRAPRRH